MKFLSVDEASATVTESTQVAPVVANPYNNASAEPTVDTSIEENKTPEETKSDDIDLDKLIDNL